MTSLGLKPTGLELWAHEWQYLRSTIVPISSASKIALGTPMYQAISLALPTLPLCRHTQIKHQDMSLIMMCVVIGTPYVPNINTRAC